MRNLGFKLILFLLCFSVIFSFSFVLADEEEALGAETGVEEIIPDDEYAGEETIIQNIANRILSAFMYFAYAIAIGSLIFLGVKYLMSPANERANLKELFPKYLIGMVFILCCFTISTFVADIAGNDKAEEIVEVGENVTIKLECDHTFPPKGILVYTEVIAKEGLIFDAKIYRFYCSNQCGYFKEKTEYENQRKDDQGGF